MTENYPAASAPPLPGGPPEPQFAPEENAAPAPGPADVAKDQAADLGHSGLQAGKHATDTARDQAATVAAEAGRQGRDLLREAQGQLGEQVAKGHQQLAGQLLTVSDELSSMAENSSQNGPATELARRAASRTRDAGQWLSDREPAEVLDELQSFARRRPGVFIALAAGAGLAAGRLTRGLKAASDSGSGPADSGSTSARTAPQPASVWSEAAAADSASTASPLPAEPFPGSGATPETGADHGDPAVSSPYYGGSSAPVSSDAYGDSAVQTGEQTGDWGRS